MGREGPRRTPGRSGSGRAGASSFLAPSHLQHSGAAPGSGSALHGVPGPLHAPGARPRPEPMGGPGRSSEVGPTTTPAGRPGPGGRALARGGAGRGARAWPDQGVSDVTPRAHLDH